MTDIRMSVTTRDNLRLQYQTCTGNWMDCGNRTEEFLSRCERHNGLSADGKIVPRCCASGNLTRSQVVEALLAGAQLRNDARDWYSQCRSGAAHEAALLARRTASAPARMVTCDCGHTVEASQVMGASLGSACPDCYDRMSA